MGQIDPEINLAWLHPPRLKKLKILNQFDVNCLQMKLLNPNIMLKRHFNRKLNLPPCSKFVFFSCRFLRHFVTSCKKCQTFIYWQQCQFSQKSNIVREKKSTLFKREIQLNISSDSVSHRTQISRIAL